MLNEYFFRILGKKMKLIVKKNMLKLQSSL